MSSQPLLDFEALVAPIPGENPAGVKDLSAIRSELDELRKEINPETFAKNDPRRPEAAVAASESGPITREIVPSGSTRNMLGTLEMPYALLTGKSVSSVSSNVAKLTPK